MGAGRILQRPVVVLTMWWRMWRRQPKREADGGDRLSSSQVPSCVRCASGQQLGERERQEDELGFMDGSTLNPQGQHPVAVVADGMGGHVRGEVASRLAVRAFIESYGTEGRPSDRLRVALEGANRAIDDTIRRDASLDGMGTTLVAAAVTADGLEWISVGDSPLWLYRHGRLKRLNEDHSMAPVIDAMRGIDPATADGMHRHELRSAVVGRPLTKVDVSTMPELLQAGDLILLASDGLNALDEVEIASIVDAQRQDGPEAVKDALLTAVAARRMPEQDNVTVVLLEAPGSPAGMGGG